ncbi:MAG: carboxypeptidase regulatory-like domain-containing protein [Fidelibacterota bacterium]
MMKNIPFVKAILSILIVSCVYAGTDGTIRGRITDLDGNPLPGAQVYIRELGMGAIADIDGGYIIINVPVGTYDVTVEMIGYQKMTKTGVNVIMDKTVWLNYKLPIQVIEGDVVEVVETRELVEKGNTSKKITVAQETIESLPIRDLTELYSLQSGVVKVESMTLGIPDHEERGLEEVHVRGGRAGEIAYMIDGLYIRNPIFGGIGNGTRLNLFAVKEFDWQPGGFNAEYGDALSAVSNMHTAAGTDEFKYKFKYETSLVGASLGNEYDDLRGYNDYVFGVGGPFPFFNKLKYWVSGQWTNRENYRVYKFDDIIYQENPDDPYNTINRSNLVQPWDNVAGFRGFGFDKTYDIFGKLTYKLNNSLRFNFSVWDVNAHRKGFNTRYLYWDNGQNELFRDTRRYTLEANHSLNSKSFYTVRVSRFIQQQFQGVRWEDSDKDGYPDWFEWRYQAGPNRTISDPHNPDVVPFTISENGDTLHYTRRDLRSGWYYGATPGLYNWEVAEDFTDVDGDGIFTPDVDIFNAADDLNGNGVWDGPDLTEKAYYRDGSYWLEPEMYEDYEPFFDYRFIDHQYEQDPWWNFFMGRFGPRYTGTADNPYYYMPTVFGGYAWEEGRTFGGSDRFYGTSTAITDEFRLDYTNQLTNEWRLRIGVDYKSHKLNFYELKNPWSEKAFFQTFAEYWQDTGPDGLLPGDPDYVAPDRGENNGRYDKGEDFSDANNNGKWDDYREPEELSAYIQNTYEVPWMVINAGIRVDAVNYNTQIWADTNGTFTPQSPWYYSDLNNNNRWDRDEPVDNDPGFAHERVILKQSTTKYKISPRLGISHVITDKATFTFSYGLYYQTPIYQNVYLNTNRVQDPQNAFEEGEGAIGNATMSAARTSAYEFGFNVQFSRYWAFSLLGWAKNMDQLVSFQHQRSGVYSYQVASTNDYGNAKGVDFTLENRGQLFNIMLQYTYSVAKANSAYDWASLGLEYIDAPSYEFLMPYDRPHDFTATIYTFLPFGIRAGMNIFYQSGAPYTPMIFNGDRPEPDQKNVNTKRAPAFTQVNLSLSKGMHFADYRVSMGLNVFNLFNFANEIDIFPLTGRANDPGEYYTNFIGLPDENHDKSGSFYDMPWMYSNPRQINFFMRIDFK